MNQNETYVLLKGSVPLLVSMPHIGTNIPVDLRANYALPALQVEDTDWHLNRLYNFLGELGASVLMPKTSRYVIDLNRPPNDEPMYPGAANTELCPTRTFSGEPLYQLGMEPDAKERARRFGNYWEPYHMALQGELARLKAMHGCALLWDAHSIRSEIPRLFDGRLPDLNIGTAGGASADPRITDAIVSACQSQSDVSMVVNGRFKGGYITRQYGRPAEDVHAIQLEMCQSLYMEEVMPFRYSESKASAIQPLLKSVVASALHACRSFHDE